MIAATYPLSHGQKGIWFVEQLRPATSAYNDREAFRLVGPLDVAAFCLAVDLLVERHEILRTRVATFRGHPCQLVDDCWASRVHSIKARGATSREEQINDWIRELAERPLDLEQGPLFSVDLLDFDDDDRLLVFNMHHIATDGWSLHLMLTEISSLYADLVAGRTPNLAPPTQYGAFVLWQEVELQGPARAALTSYWLEQLSGAPVILDFGSNRSHDEAARSASLIEFDIPEVVSDQVRELAGNHGVTFFMALLGAFEVTLAWACRTNDLVVGIPVVGRSLPDFARSLGFFANLLPIRSDLRSDPTSGILLRRVRECVLGGFAHQDLPFEQLVAELNPDRSDQAHPLVQATFQLIDESFDAALHLENLEVTGVPINESEIVYDITLDLHAVAGGLHGRLTYMPNAVEPQLAQSIAELYSAVAAAFSQDEATPVSQIVARCASQLAMNMAIRNAIVVSGGLTP